jgi:hypothetical protein
MSAVLKQTSALQVFFPKFSNTGQQYIPDWPIVSAEKREIRKIIMQGTACGTKTSSDNQEHNTIASALGFMNKETCYEDAARVSGVS